jgi:hypothetical protein
MPLAQAVISAILPSKRMASSLPDTLCFRAS